MGYIARPSCTIFGRGPRMDIRKVKKLIELLEESGIAELEIREGEETVRISRMPTGPIATHVQTYAAPAPLAAPPVAAAPAAATPTAAAPKSNDHVVQAPMVGTFYSAPAPGAKAFVQIGDEVKVGQVRSEEHTSELQAH